MPKEEIEEIEPPKPPKAAPKVPKVRIQKMRLSHGTVGLSFHGGIPENTYRISLDNIRGH